MKAGSTIWKYQLAMMELQNVAMREGAEILSVQFQHGGGLCLWALVNPDAPEQRRKIEIIGTGNLMSDASRFYIGTVQSPGPAQFVWHIFERE